MAIRVRCAQCGKRISMDDAFAGGACRCPYCGAINVLREDRAAAQPQRRERPEAPGGRPRPGGPDRTSQADQPEAPPARPQMPAGPAAPEPSAGRAHRHIPTARPVRTQGIVGLVAAVLLLALLAGGAWLALKLGLWSGGPRPRGRDVTEQAARPPRTVDVAQQLVRVPVVYCVHAGGEAAALAADLVARSVAGLEAGVRFDVYVPAAGDGRWLADAVGWRRAGNAAPGDVALFLREVPAERPALAEAVTAALERLEGRTPAPGGIAVLTDSPVPDGEMASLRAAAQRARQAGVPLTLIGLTDAPGQAERLEEIARLSGGAGATFAMEGWRAYLQRQQAAGRPGE
jgi:hypothetical protein